MSFAMAFILLSHKKQAFFEKENRLGPIESVSCLACWPTRGRQRDHPLQHYPGNDRKRNAEKAEKYSFLYTKYSNCILNTASCSFLSGFRGILLGLSTPSVFERPASWRGYRDCTRFLQRTGGFLCGTRVHPCGILR